jgi:hypothetical protein
MKTIYLIILSAILIFGKKQDNKIINGCRRVDQGKCLECIDSTYKLNNNKCEKIIFPAVPSCDKQVGSECVTCNAGFILNNGTCVSNVIFYHLGSIKLESFITDLTKDMHSAKEKTILEYIAKNAINKKEEEMKTDNNKNNSTGIIFFIKIITK